MGMFDHVVVDGNEPWLTVKPAYIGSGFQTKSFEKLLESYWIKDGTLYKDISSCTDGEECWLEYPITKTIQIYDIYPPEQGGTWVEYKIEIVNGLVVSADLVIDK